MEICDPTYAQRLLESLITIVVFLGVTVPISTFFLTLYNGLEGSIRKKIVEASGITFLFFLLIWVLCYFFLRSLIPGYHL